MQRKVDLVSILIDPSWLISIIVGRKNKDRTVTSVGISLNIWKRKCKSLRAALLKTSAAQGAANRLLIANNYKEHFWLVASSTYAKLWTSFAKRFVKKTQPLLSTLKTYSQTLSYTFTGQKLFKILNFNSFSLLPRAYQFHRKSKDSNNI